MAWFQWIVSNVGTNGNSARATEQKRPENAIITIQARRLRRNLCMAYPRTKTGVPARA
jgi:hypothetical protein